MNNKIHLRRKRTGKGYLCNLTNAPCNHILKTCSTCPYVDNLPKVTNKNHRNNNENVRISIEEKGNEFVYYVNEGIADAIFALCDAYIELK